MAEQEPVPTTPAQPAAAAAPAAPPAPAAAPPARPAQQSRGRGQQTPQRLPQEDSKAWMKRVRQAAHQQIQRELGVSLDQAKQLLKNAEAGKPAPAAATQQATVVDAKQRAENERLKQENAKLKKDSEEQKRKAEKRARDLEDELADRDIRDAAKDKGCNDPSYAAFRFAQAQAGSKEQLDPSAFFDEMKKTAPHFFTAAPPVQVPAVTAPPASAAPGGAQPSANSAAAAPAKPAGAEKPVDDLDTESFQKRTADLYGFTPGRS